MLRHDTQARGDVATSVGSEEADALVREPRGQEDGALPSAPQTLRSSHVRGVGTGASHASAGSNEVGGGAAGPSTELPGWCCCQSAAERPPCEQVPGCPSSSGREDGLSGEGDWGALAASGGEDGGMCCPGRARVPTRPLVHGVSCAAQSSRELTASIWPSGLARGRSPIASGGERPT